jgi:TolB-like protein/cytochrome c-type biogenesis protein CcmH/NrfG
MDTSVVRFASFQLDCRSRELREGSRLVRLQEQPFEILRVMLERPGDVVTRDELRRRLWPDGTFVDFEHSLNAAIKRLRAALGDDADSPRFVETLPRRGYRFIASLDERPSGAGAGRAASPQTRLVVLPFSNLSDDSSQEYFSDGLTEELIAQLGPLCRGRVAVIARWSSMVFKGSLQRAREIGETLQADYLLEGSTRRDGPRVRITARLVEAASEAHLWSDTYERTTDDWLTVQTDVAGRVARSLMAEIAPNLPMTRATARPNEAYQAYLRGRYHWAKPGDVGLQDALRSYEEAIRLAPDFAAAHGALARVRLASADYYREMPRLALVDARDTAMRALALDPTLSEAHAVVGDTRLVLDLDWGGAEAAYVRALSINPSNEVALRSYGVLLALQSRSEEAFWQVDSAVEVDPLCLVANTVAAWVRYLSGNVEAAIDRCRHTLDLDQDFGAARRILGAAHLLAGRPEDADAAFEAAVEREPAHPVHLAWLAHARSISGRHTEARTLIARARGLEDVRYVSSYHLALAHAGLGDLDEAFSCLDRAWLDRDPALPGIVVEPRFDALRADARYQELAARLNRQGLGIGDRGPVVLTPNS